MTKEEFNKLYSEVYTYDEWKEHVNWFWDKLVEARKEGYEEGRNSVLDELKEDQKKLLAGFSYKKDAGMSDTLSFIKKKLE